MDNVFNGVVEIRGAGSVTGVQKKSGQRRSLGNVVDVGVNVFSREDLQAAYGDGGLIGIDVFWNPV